MSTPRQPFFTYVLMLALGAAPTAFVTYFYTVLPNRLVTRWDVYGNITILGTRPGTVLLIANFALVVALVGTAISLWQQRSLFDLGMRRAFLALNLAQIVAINLACAMIVSDALGLFLKLKPTIPPVMAVVLFSAGVLFWRIGPNGGRLARTLAVVLAVAGLVLLGFSALAVNAVVGYFAASLAILAMIAVALPQTA